MQKAAEDLKNEAKAKAEAKEKYINDLVPMFSTDGKDIGRGAWPWSSWQITFMLFVLLYPLFP